MTDEEAKNWDAAIAVRKLDVAAFHEWFSGSGLNDEFRLAAGIAWSDGVLYSRCHPKRAETFLKACTKT